MDLINDSEMKAYYKERAPIYDRVYSYPERQEDLRFLEKYIPDQFASLNIIEVAAGTGYWTQFISRKADSILATDATIETLVQIQQRPLINRVQTQVVDAYSIGQLPQKFDGVFAGLWLSHVPIQRMKEFLDSMHKVLSSGAIVVLLDNSLAQCIRLPITYTDEVGNTYQDREFDDGTVHRVLKNFPSKVDLIEVTSARGNNHKYIELHNFWLFQYQAR